MLFDRNLARGHSRYEIQQTAGSPATIVRHCTATLQQTTTLWVGHPQDPRTNLDGYKISSPEGLIRAYNGISVSPNNIPKLL